MSAFKVGQRVRLARPVRPQNLNLTGVIREIFDVVMVIGGLVNCVCDWDDGTKGGLGAGEMSCHTDQLEPTQYDGNQTVSWESCLWRPTGVAA